MPKQNNILISFYKAFKSIAEMFPLLFGIILLLGLVRTLISKKIISSLFMGKLLQDTVIGSIIGSVAAGNPITSYIIGGELLERGVSLFAVTSFIVAWVTVGAVQLPAEAVILGRRFAFTRNILSFIFSIVVAIATATTLRVLQ